MFTSAYGLLINLEQVQLKYFRFLTPIVCNVSNFKNNWFFEFFFKNDVKFEYDLIQDRIKYLI